MDDVTYRAFFAELEKIAEEEPNSLPLKQMAKIVGSGVLGFGLGTAGGMALGYGADMLSRAVTGKSIPREAVAVVAPLLGTASGLAYSRYQAKQQEAIRRAIEDQAAGRERNVPGR